MKRNSFAYRHIGPKAVDVDQMLSTIGLDSIDTLIEQTIPKAIRAKKELALSESMTEAEFGEHIAALGEMNSIFKTYIGMGYHPTVLPGVIQRNILENPGWYTAYTPYQAEIAQGRLEALLNFQTMVSDLTGNEIANASLLDEGTAAAEAMTMLYSARRRGGIFLYPADNREKYREGRLRLTYEANPIAYLVEQANGMATNGTEKILNLDVKKIHQRTALIFGSKEEVIEFKNSFDNP